MTLTLRLQLHENTETDLNQQRLNEKRRSSIDRKGNTGETVKPIKKTNIVEKIRQNHKTKYDARRINIR